MAATPEKYKNEKLRRALDDVNIHPGPMITMNPYKEDDIDLGRLSPWKVWKVNTPSRLLTAREYVEAHTRAESWGRIDLEKPLAGASWPEVPRRFSWTNAMIFCSLMALVGWVISL